MTIKCSGIALVALFLSISTHAETDYSQAWQEPLSIKLPEQGRSVLLRRDVEPHQWLTQSGIENAQVTRLGRQHLVEFKADDEAWQTVAQQQCNSAQVASCENVQCQSIQMDASVAGSRSDKVKARIVPRQQTLNNLDAAGAATTCQNPLALGLASPSGEGTQLGLELPDLDLSRDSRARPATESRVATPADQASVADPNAAEPASSHAANTAAKAQLPLQLTVSNLVGQPTFSATDLPADTTGYDLLVGEGCREVRVPLDSVEPAFVPGIVVATVNAAEVQNVAATHGLTVLESVTLPHSGENLVTYATSGDLLSMLSLLLLDGRVQTAQKEYLYTTSASGYTDPYEKFNYGPESTGAVRLHPATRGGGQTLAVIDTGVDLEHPELAGRVQGTDFTGEGFTPDLHGTAVAGIIAAAANNAIGVYGVAPETNILALKACQPVVEGELAARCKTSSLVKALDAAAAAQVGIVNMSLAGPPDPLVKRFISTLTSADVLVVAGAGNGGAQAKPAHPAALPGVLAVTAVDRRLEIYAAANRGGYIDLAAPGVDIITAQPGDAYPTSSGTSWAAAHVTGIAALLKDLVPFVGASEIALILSASAGDLGSTGADEVYGSGLVNACAAAQAATADAVACGEAHE